AKGRATRPPARPGHRWVAGDLHAHTVHSDGRLSVDELAALARSVGLDWLAVTDHNTVSHHRELAAASRRYAVTLVPGQEVTTPSGHANGFGDLGWIDFRADADSWLDHATSRGGLLSINHPLAGDCSWHQPIHSSPQLVEVWHFSWDRRSEAPIEWWRGHPGAMPVGGSDFHRPEWGTPGTPTTWVEVEGDDGDAPPAVKDILASLRTGRIAMSATPDAPVVVDAGERIVACNGASARLSNEHGLRMALDADTTEVERQSGLWRVTDSNGHILALTLVP
ncbi:MAG: CehA/McbA family metallohydrolase, partial [Acidimicrobiales bacterium]